jgi:hypothetical protein
MGRFWERILRKFWDEIVGLRTFPDVWESYLRMFRECPGKNMGNSKGSMGSCSVIITLTTNAMKDHICKQLCAWLSPYASYATSSSPSSPIE